MRKSKPIHVKLVGSVFLALVLFFAFIVKSTSDIISFNVRNETYDHYQLLANDTAERINSWLSAKSEIIENQRSALETINIFDSEYLCDFLSRSTISRKDLEDICDFYFVDPENTLSTANGYYTDPSIDLRERDWYTRCLVTRDLFFSSPYLDLSTGSFVMTVSAATHNRSGKFMGVLAIDVYIDAFLNVANNAVVPENSYVFLIDGNYGIATHPNPGYAYINNLPVFMSDIPDKIYGELQAKIDRGDYSRTSVTDYDGEVRDMFTSVIDCCSWYVVAAVSDNVLHSTERIMVTAISCALFISLLVGVLWTFVGTRSIMKKLSTAMEAANTANETKSSFLANMSHEIRTPINAVLGMNEMILREDINDSVKEYALDIAAASRSLISIINDILDFSKIESGKIEMIENEFNIASMINDIVSMSMSRLGEKPLELIVNIDPTLPVGLNGDEMRLKQVIVNLMTNGIKYTNEGFVSLNITYTEREYGINLDVAVRDSGIGISQENLEKLFTSFQRVDTKRNRSVEGTGLGLAITKRIVERMGGFVNVTSEYGVGSEFRVTIPIRVTNSKPFIIVKEPEKIHAVCMFDFDGLDMRTSREYTRLFPEMARKMKTDIRMCRNTESLKELVSQRNITVIFIDRKSYLENENYITYITEMYSELKVILVQDRANPVSTPDNIRSINKPFYAIPASAVLNNEKSFLEANVRRDTVSGFIAPDAKILIVDDNFINLKVAVGLMKPYQMNVFTADSGAKAIEMLRESQDYTIVFMDHMMPGMDGIEATAIIRGKKGDYFKNVPIIALTANTVNNARNMFLDSGFDDFLAKPIDISMLDRILRKFLPDSMRKHGVVPVQGAQVQEEPEKPAESSVFDPAEGLRYTGNDRELYIDVLLAYVKGSVAMREQIARFREENDIENYTIKVHALKSTSLNIGAAKLSELAKKLEYAGKDNNKGLIEAETDGLLSLYADVLAEIKTYLADNGITYEEKSSVPADLSELRELTEEEVDELFARFAAACDDFEREAAIGIANEAEGTRFGDKALGDWFSRAEKMIDDFEYDEALELIEELKKECGRE